jgi:hypothetical protein
MSVVDHLKKGDKSSSNLSKLLGDHINLYRSEGFYINQVVSDNEPAMAALKPTIQAFGARHVTGGVKSNTLASIDRHIRLIKDRVRSILHSIPFSLPKFLMQFAVSRINLLNHSFSKEGHPSPRELFTARKVDFRRDIRVSFGEYCECFSASTDNTTRERSLSCIALCPTNNKNGSVLFYSLKTKKIIRCDNWKSLPYTPEVLSVLNSLSKDLTPVDPTFTYHGDSIDSALPPDQEMEVIASQHAQYQEVMNLPLSPTLEEHRLPENLISSADQSDDFADDFPIADPPPNLSSPLPHSESSHPSRLRRRPPDLDEYEVYNVSIKEALLDSPDLVHQAIVTELQQMLSKNVFHPVTSSPIRPIPSKLFLEKKLNSKGNVMKWKARLVAGGHRQEPDETVLRSSPELIHDNIHDCR